MGIKNDIALLYQAKKGVITLSPKYDGRELTEVELTAILALYSLILRKPFSEVE